MIISILMSFIIILYFTCQGLIAGLVLSGETTATTAKEFSDKVKEQCSLTEAVLFGPALALIYVIKLIPGDE